MRNDPVLDLVIDYACWFTAFGAIGTYVLVFLRNRPHLRPLNALGLLLVGGALLGLPTAIVHPIASTHQAVTIFVVVLLVASALFQAISAFRRRPRERAGDGAAAPTAAAGR
ncbi:MAG TPA: hypothetical protein VG407_01845 [Caulobacteraceae bacterium]|nr:hypothetical protein [Caulobacteraceae bacterium]